MKPGVDLNNLETVLVIEKGLALEKVKSKLALSEDHSSLVDLPDTGQEKKNIKKKQQKKKIAKAKKPVKKKVSSGD